MKITEDGYYIAQKEGYCINGSKATHNYIIYVYGESPFFKFIIWSPEARAESEAEITDFTIISKIEIPECVIHEKEEKELNNIQIPINNDKSGSLGDSPVIGYNAKYATASGESSQILAEKDAKDKPLTFLPNIGLGKNGGDYSQKQYKSKLTKDGFAEDLLAHAHGYPAKTNQVGTNYTKKNHANCILIGIRAGAKLAPNTENVVIIGDNVESLDRTQKNVLFIGNNVAIGETIKGIKINLKEVLEKLYANTDIDLSTLNDNEQIKRTSAAARP